MGYMWMRDMDTWTCQDYSIQAIQDYSLVPGTHQETIPRVL